MDLPLFEDDRHEPGMIQAHRLDHDGRDLPAAAVLCFFNDLLERLAASGTLRSVYALHSEIGHHPVYELALPEGVVAVVHPGVGSPLAASFVEELAANGARAFVACGGAGALTEGLAVGHLMVVESALRDEGTSFHYAPPSRVIDADPLGVAVLEDTLRAAGLPYFVGRTWTTDAFLRETRSRVRRRVEEGCAMVDMESSAFIAVARFRGLRFAQLLYAGDTLAGEEWDSRHWDSRSDVRERLFYVAARGALALLAAPG